MGRDEKIVCRRCCRTGVLSCRPLSLSLCRVVGTNESLVNLLLYLISKRGGGDDFFFFFTNMGMDGSCWVGLRQIVRPCGRI